MGNKSNEGLKKKDIFKWKKEDFIMLKNILEDVITPIRFLKKYTKNFLDTILDMKNSNLGYFFKKTQEQESEKEYY